MAWKLNQPHSYSISSAFHLDPQNTESRQASTFLPSLTIVVSFLALLITSITIISFMPIIEEKARNFIYRERYAQSKNTALEVGKQSFFKGCFNSAASTVDYSEETSEVTTPSILSPKIASTRASNSCTEKSHSKVEKTKSSSEDVSNATTKINKRIVETRGEQKSITSNANRRREFDLKKRDELMNWHEKGIDASQGSNITSTSNNDKVASNDQQSVTCLESQIAHPLSERKSSMSADDIERSCSDLLSAGKIFECIDLLQLKIAASNSADMCGMQQKILISAIRASRSDARLSEVLRRILKPQIEKCERGWQSVECVARLIGESLAAIAQSSIDLTKSYAYQFLDHEMLEFNISILDATFWQHVLSTLCENCHSPNAKLISQLRLLHEIRGCQCLRHLLETCKHRSSTIQTLAVCILQDIKAAHSDLYNSAIPFGTDNEIMSKVVDHRQQSSSESGSDALSVESLTANEALLNLKLGEKNAGSSYFSSLTRHSAETSATTSHFSETSIRSSNLHLISVNGHTPSIAERPIASTPTELYGEEYKDRQEKLELANAALQSIEKTLAEVDAPMSEIVPSLKNLMRVFTSLEEEMSAERVLNALQKCAEVDAEIHLMAMQTCCSLGHVTKASDHLESIFRCCDTSSDKALTSKEEEKVVFPEKKEMNLDMASKATQLFCNMLIDFRQNDQVVDFLLDTIERRKIRVNSEAVTQIFLKLFRSLPERHLANRLLNITLFGIDVSNSKETLEAQTINSQMQIGELFFTWMVDCCVKFRNDSYLAVILERYRRDWCNRFTADVQTCGVMIKALGVARRVDDFRWMFWHITEVKGLEPTEVTYGCMLDALVNNGKVSEAVGIFEAMKAKGKVRPNTIMYSTLVKGYAQEKQLDEALQIHDEMKELNISINTVTYNTLVDACARVGAMDKAAALLEDMLSSGIEPDLITFSTIAKGYCVQGDVQRAMQLLAAMRERGIKPDGILYNSLLDGCVRALRPDLCEQLWQQMQNSGIPPSNFTLTILIKMFGRAGKLNRAFEAVRELPKRYGFNINAHVYTCLMSACIANKEFSKALEVFNCMQTDRVMADAKTYETVLFGVTRWKNFDAALKIVRSAFQLDEAQQSISYRKIVGFQMETRNFRNLWNAMREADQIDVATQTIDDLRYRYNASVNRIYSQKVTV